MNQLYQVLEERGPDAKSAFYWILVNKNYFLFELFLVQPEKRGRFGGDPETTSLIKQQQKLKEENGELRQQLGLFSEGDSCGNNEGTEMKPLLRRSPADVDVEKGGIYSNY
ncbi:hypothetical protein UPYG_G00247080 [Umbra pygmaea]|uniref:Uncharacterized protein n=1 Tax=Umbra pygmaea TaxID=75934 RepID=A0ABD0WGF1_UMBPY